MVPYSKNFAAKCELFFCLTQDKAYSWMFHLKTIMKNISCSKKL